MDLMPFVLYIKMPFEAFNLETVHEILPYVDKILYKVPKTFGHLADSITLGIVDVVGDGWCGYYALGLVAYVLSGQVLGATDVADKLKNIYKMLKMKQNITHWLEYIEFAAYGKRHRFNVGVFSRDEEKGNYTLRYAEYSSDANPWVFAIMAGNYNSHYKLLAREVPDNQLRIDFNADEAQIIFALMQATYPEPDTNTYTYIQVKNALLSDKDLIRLNVKPKPLPFGSTIKVSPWTDAEMIEYAMAESPVKENPKPIHAHSSSSPKKKALAKKAKK